MQFQNILNAFIVYALFFAYSVSSWSLFKILDQQGNSDGKIDSSRIRRGDSAAVKSKFTIKLLAYFSFISL
jgi:hypothetical protein